MIEGHVNDDLQPIVRLTVVGLFGDRQIEFILDTGFTGEMSLSTEAAISFGFPLIGRSGALLADGRFVENDVRAGIVLWHGSRRVVEVDVAESKPVIGMALIERHEVRIEAVSSGRVLIVPLAP